MANIRTKMISLFLAASIVQQLAVGLQGCTNTLYSKRQLNRIQTAETAETGETGETAETGETGQDSNIDTPEDASEPQLETREQTENESKPSITVQSQVIEKSEDTTEITGIILEKDVIKYTVTFTKIPEQTLTVDDTTLTPDDIVNNNVATILVGQWNSLKPYYGTLEIQEQLFIKQVNDLQNKILQLDEANQYVIVDADERYYTQEGITPVKFVIINDNNNNKAVYTVARDSQDNKLYIYRIDCRANITLAKRLSPFNGSVKISELNSVKLYENGEKFQEFRVVYNVDPQIPIQNMDASKVTAQNIQNISVNIYQMTKDVDLDTMYIMKDPGLEDKQTMNIQIGLINPDTSEVVTYTGTFEYDNKSKDNVINLYEIVNDSKTLDSITG